MSALGVNLLTRGKACEISIRGIKKTELIRVLKRN